MSLSMQVSKQCPAWMGRKAAGSVLLLFVKKGLVGLPEMCNNKEVRLTFGKMLSQFSACQRTVLKTVRLFMCCAPLQK